MSKLIKIVPYIINFEEVTGKYKLCKARGYFYITSDDVETANEIATWYDNAIYVYGFNQQSIEDWVRDIADIIDKNKEGI